MKFFATVLLVCALNAYVQARHSSMEMMHRTPMRNDYDDESQTRQWSSLSQQLQDWKVNAPSNWDREVTNNIDLAPFLRKIDRRLDESSALSTKPEKKEKIKEMVRNQMYKCKTLSGEGIDSACAARQTGHVMQLISAVEKMNRDLPGMTGQASNY